MKTGDTCPSCRQGRLRVRTSRPKAEGWYEQRLECTNCRHKEVAIVPTSDVVRRCCIQHKTVSEIADCC